MTSRIVVKCMRKNRLSSGMGKCTHVFLNIVKLGTPNRIPYTYGAELNDRIKLLQMSGVLH